MIRLFIWSLALGVIAVLGSCSTHPKTGAAAYDAQGRADAPVITFIKDSIDLGKIVKGAKVPMTFDFVNTGSAALVIEIVTTCKCTRIDWPRQPIPPGGAGRITATYDTTDQPLGAITKTLDIVSNTDPMLIEAIFTAEIVSD